MPPGVPVAGAFAVTSARIVTCWPNTDGLGEEVTVVVVCATSTSWSSSRWHRRTGVALVVALITWSPASRLVVGETALPLTSATGPPSGAPSTKDWTSPVGVPAPGALTVRLAGNVSGSPATASEFYV